MTYRTKERFQELLDEKLEGGGIKKNIMHSLDTIICVYFETDSVQKQVKAIHYLMVRFQDHNGKNADTKDAAVTVRFYEDITQALKYLATAPKRPHNRRFGHLAFTDALFGLLSVTEAGGHTETVVRYLFKELDCLGFRVEVS